MSQIEIAKRFFKDMLEHQDLTVLDDIIHPDYRAIPISRNKVASIMNLIDETKLKSPGLEGIKNRQKQLFQQFSNFKFSFNNTVSDGNQVVFFYDLSFDHTGSWHNFPPTGKRISIAGVHLFRFKDNLIIEIKAMMGTLDLLKQIGDPSGIDDEQHIVEYLNLLKQYLYSS